MAEMDVGHEGRWKVGELARATGLTVRALHHYDEVGLLVPSERTPAGHRLYAEADVRRLYRVLALRRLGMRLDEIASLLDDERVSLVETVRRHLDQVERQLERQQLLRQRLRHILEALERSIEPAVEEFIDALEAMAVIEAEVEDVVIRLPADGLDEPPPRLAREGNRVVLLRERGGELVLPIWIGPHEGDALALHRARPEGTPRPLGPDLTVSLLKAGGVEVERVVIESIRDYTFFATVTVAVGGESHEVDARPSDALNLAARVGAPVFVSAELIDQAGVRPDATAFQSRLSEADADAGGWRSLSPDVMRSLYPEEAAPFERISEQARRAMTFAREEARASGDDHVRVEHIMLGLLREEGLAATVLESLDITEARVRDRLSRTQVSHEPVTRGLPPPTPDVKQLWQLAQHEASPTGREDIDTQHLLLGLARAGEGLLLELGVDAERVREEATRALGADEDSAPGAVPDSEPELDREPPAAEHDS